jgi:hypothetical protein
MEAEVARNAANVRVHLCPTIQKAAASTHAQSTQPLLDAPLRAPPLAPVVAAAVRVSRAGCVSLPPVRFRRPSALPPLSLCAPLVLSSVLLVLPVSVPCLPVSLSALLLLLSSCARRQESRDRDRDRDRDTHGHSA